MGKHKVFVIVPLYNAAAFLRGCFGSLSGMERGELEVTVVAIDDWSKDDTKEIMVHEFPWVRLERTPKNGGFGACCNHGLRLALAAGADYVYLLNQDTEVAPEFLVEAVRAIEANPGTGSVQSLLIQHPETDLVNSAGNAIHFLGFGYCLGYRTPLAQLKAQDGQEIAYASGAGVLYLADALREVGVFDEILYMYHEDLDLGWRLRLAGYANRLALKSRVFHKYEFSRSITKYFWMERNRYYVMLKNLRPWSIVVLWPWVMLAEIGLLPAAIRGGWWREKLKAYVWLFQGGNWRRLAMARRETQAKRRVSDRIITRLFVAPISYQEVAGPFQLYVANPLMSALWFVLRRLII
ncbi:MAG: glycosyltransferase family 2 protein [Patescibacteria group bacterium]|nr:glycosyltransferase family 2 protein [Patescibacteria group bacterium]